MTSQSRDDVGFGDLGYLHESVDDVLGVARCHLEEDECLLKDWQLRLGDSDCFKTSWPMKRRD